MQYVLIASVLMLSSAHCGVPQGTGEAAASPAEASALGPVAPIDSMSWDQFEQVMTHARAAEWHRMPLGDIVQAVGMQFLGTPYEGFTLDQTEQEELVADLTRFDCVLFVESALALAWGIAAQDYTYEGFLQRLQDQRYRGGILDGYCSRLHYFTEWILDNAARGNVVDITRKLGGVPLEKTLTFMGTHRDSYPRLVTNDSLFQGILDMEARLADLEHIYIPQDQIASVYPMLQAGDIMATVTNIEGLDVSHSGFVYDAGDGRKGFLHASTKGGVKVSPDLQAYVQNNKIQIGIVVARPKARP